MTAPPPTRPTSHRATPPLSQTVQRVLPPLMSVTAVVAVIVILLVLNSRPSHHDAGPAVVPPSTSPSATPSDSPSVSPSSPAPSARHSSAPAPPVTEPSATQPPVVAQPPVTVLNNSRRQGLAAHVAAELRSRGWPIRQTGNFTGRIVATTAYYPPGERAAAERLAREFGQVQRVEPRFAGLPGSGLTLVVTRSWTG